MKNIRHGDILLTKIEEVRGEVVKHSGKFVLAEGETTGHKHVLTVPKIDDMEIHRTVDGAIILTLKKEGQLSHEEHKTISVPTGNYIVSNEREKDWFSLAVRKVVSGEMPFKDILAIIDTDQRTQAMKYGDVKKFLEWSDAKELDTYSKETLEGIKINYSLYEIPAKEKLFTETAYYVIYDCPSTGKVYMSGVEKCKTVAEAFGWKFQITPQDWQNMIPLVHES